MFKLKKGNVIQKLNSMDRKQMYTYGGIVVALMVVLVLLASFLGNAEDSSFDGFSSRGYDLANSPFITDEAEEYLLASKYPDMQENQMNLLYSPEEKEARQQEDAAQTEEEQEEEEENARSYDGDSEEKTSSAGSRGYTGYRGGGGGSAPKTEVNSLGKASLGQAGGSWGSDSWGGPRLDTNPYKERNVDTGKNQTQKVETQQDAKRSMAQFAQGSRAAAGLKDNRNLNFKRAVLGGGSEASAFRDDGTVDWSKVDPSQLDTNAPQTGTPDLDSLEDKVKDAADKAKENEDNKEKTEWWEPFMDMAMRLGEHLLTNFLDNQLAQLQENNKMNSLYNGYFDALYQSWDGNMDTIPAALKDAGVSGKYEKGSQEYKDNYKSWRKRYTQGQKIAQTQTQSCPSGYVWTGVGGGCQKAS